MRNALKLLPPLAIALISAATACSSSEDDSKQAWTCSVENTADKPCYCHPDSEGPLAQCPSGYTCCTDKVLTDNNGVETRLCSCTNPTSCVDMVESLKGSSMVKSIRIVESCPAQ